MKTHFTIIVFLLLVGLTACQHKTHWLKEAEAHYGQGLKQRAVIQTEKAAESFSEALLAIGHCDLDNPK